MKVILLILLSFFIISSCSTTRVTPWYDNPDITKLNPDDIAPTVDFSELEKNLVYPEKARQAGIEGKVIVRVLINKNGEIKKTIITYSDSELFNNAANEAIMNSTFTPAIVKGEKILCWVSVPIYFRLRY